MLIAHCTKADFDQILLHLAEFWDEPDKVAPLHHPMFVHEFGDTAFAARDGADVAAYLFGFVAQTAPVGYVHLAAVRRPYRRAGLARRLYGHFTDVARSRGCRELKAITGPANRRSIAFHTALGMETLGTPNAAGVPVIRDYSGPGQDRVVFRRVIT